MMKIDEQTKQQIKDSKLRQLAMQHYELQLQRIIYAAQEESALAESVEKQIGKIEAAVAALQKSDL